MVQSEQSLSPATQRFLDRAASVLSQCRSAASCTGPGMSAESGIPAIDETTRPAEGLTWEDVTTLRGFKATPEKVRHWYDQRRQRLKQVSPNPGHYALTELEHLLPELFVITQNTDSLHRRAGTTGVLELRGNIWMDQCLSCDYEQSLDPSQSEWPSRCPHCGDWLRPAVVWFDEALPAETFRAALEAADRCEALLAIGSSGIARPAASLVSQAKASGAAVIEISPEPTPVSAFADLRLVGPAEAVLPELVGRLRNMQPVA